MNAKKVLRAPLFWALMMLVLFMLVFRMGSGGEYARIDTSAAEQLVDDGKVEEAHFTSDNTLQLDLKEGQTYSDGEAVKDATKVETEFVDARAEHLVTLVDKKVPGVVNDTIEEPGILSSLLFSLLPILLLVGLFWFLMSQAQGGGNKVMQFGKSRAKLASKEAPKVTFADVAGADEAVEELHEIKEFLKEPSKFLAVGAKIPKGVLLYGPPGTGKTHTIRYLATSLPGHTTLIITAEQVGLLGAYMSLARLLQPTMVVIEDVDLIARDREDMGGPCEESLLNKLLNEMDGLKEDCDILFVLTTNRPEELEGALAGRPGRIDQAIEVPLPDEAGRGKLIRLYGRGLPLVPSVIDAAVQRTEGVSAAFIKELMRRIAQASIARDGGQDVTADDIDGALNEMLFDGGRLNLKLLGGAQGMSAG